MDNGLAIGLIAGAALPLRRYFHNLNCRVDDARDDADDAYSLGLRNRTQLNLIRDAVGNGDHLRLAYDAVQDTLVGLAYGAGQPPETPAVMPAVGGVIPLVSRPTFTEAIIATHTAWPGTTNDYNDAGLLKTPSNAFNAIRTQVGAALGFNEVASFLVGLTQPADITQAAQLQIFRLARALVGSGAAKAYSPDQWRAVMDSAFSLPVTPNGSGPRGGLLYSQQTRAPGNIGASGAEEFAPPIPLPAGSFPVGRAVRITIGWYIVSANGTDTVRFGLRFGSTGGGLLYQTTAVDPGNGGDYATQTLTLVRQPDAPTGYPIITGTGQSVVKSGAAGVSEAIGYGLATPGGPASPGQLDAAYSLVPSILFSAANAANLARVEFATVELL